MCRAVAEVGELRDAPVEVGLLELNRREEAHGRSTAERGELFYVVVQLLLDSRLGHGEDLGDPLAGGSVAEQVVPLVRSVAHLVSDRVRDLVGVVARPHDVLPALAVLLPRAERDRRSSEERASRSAAEELPTMQEQ